MAAFKITTDNQIEKIDLDFSNYKNIYPAMGLNEDADLFEMVHLPRLCNRLGAAYELTELKEHKRLCMLVDEEGRLKDKPLNLIASWFYGMDVHGVPIVGDVLIVGETEDDFCDVPERVEKKLEEALLEAKAAFCD